MWLGWIVGVGVARVDCQCLSWQQFWGCHGSGLRVVHEVGPMRLFWFHGGHVSDFNFVGGGFGVGFRPSMVVVARLELVVAMDCAMGCSRCG